MNWVEKDGCWVADDGGVIGILLPVGDIGWEARVYVRGRQMHKERFFTSASAKAAAERWSGRAPWRERID